MLCGALSGDPSHRLIAEVVLTQDASKYDNLFRSYRVLRDAWERWKARKQAVPEDLCRMLERLQRRESPDKSDGIAAKVYHALDLMSAAHHVPAVQSSIRECSLEELGRYQPSVEWMAWLESRSMSKPVPIAPQHQKIWAAGVLRPQAGVEIDMPLPDIDQSDFDMVLMFWQMWQHVARFPT